MAVTKLLTALILSLAVCGQEIKNEKDLYSWEGERTWGIFTSASDFDGDGVIWKIEDDEKGEKHLYALVAYLDNPVNTCFDKKYYYLYVCEAGMDDEGSIFQYKINWSGDDDKFELEEYGVTTVFTGSSPLDCAVDSQGNLFFVTADNNIYGMTQTDIGTLGTEFVLASSPNVSDCQAIDVLVDNEIWWANGSNTKVYGTLASVTWSGAVTAAGSAGKVIQAQLTSGGEARSIATDEDRVFYTAYNLLFEYDIEEQEVIERAKHLHQPKSIAWGDGEVWIADGGSGRLYYLKDNKEPNKAEDDDVIIEIDGIRGITLINGDFAAYVAVVIAAIFF